MRLIILVLLASLPGCVSVHTGEKFFPWWILWVAAGVFFVLVFVLKQEEETTEPAIAEPSNSCDHCGLPKGEEGVARCVGCGAP